jgi:hypothetical protein
MQAVSRRGFPDLMLIFPGGRVVLVELKTSRGVLSALQKRTIERLRRQGAEVEVISSIEAFAELVRSHGGAAADDGPVV